MPLNEKDIAIIEKYLRQNLSPDEQSYFQSRESDNNFANELRTQQDLQLAFKAVGRESAKQQLQELEKRIDAESKNKVLKKGLSRRNWLLLFLGIIGLSVLFYVLSSKKAAPKNEQLFAQYTEPYPNVISSITRDIDSSGNQANPYQLYEQQNYPEAIKAFARLEETSSTDNYYLALAYLFNEEIEKCEVILSPYANSDTARFQKPAQWYLALVYLQQNKIEESRSLLNTISQTTDHPYANKARELLEEIE